MSARQHHFWDAVRSRLTFAGPSAPESHAQFRAFMLVEAAAFFAAALVHKGVLVPGHEHLQARIAETIIGCVLVLGAVASWIIPEHARGLGFGTQAIAMLGTLLGLLMIAVGFGPQSTPDLVFHAAVLLLLDFGLIVTSRAP